MMGGEKIGFVSSIAHLAIQDPFIILPPFDAHIQIESAYPRDSAVIPAWRFPVLFSNKNGRLAQEATAEFLIENRGSENKGWRDVIDDEIDAFLFELPSEPASEPA